MSPDPIQFSAEFLDLSPRIVASTAVVASPALAAETIVASITLPANIAIVSGILLVGWLAVTVGTAGVSLALQIRRTSVAGTSIVAGGATTATAAGLYTRDILGLDAGPTMPGQVYKLTLQVASASAASTVSAVTLAAIAV